MHTTHLTWSFFTGNSALKALCDAYVPSAVTSFCTIPCVIWMSSSFSSPAAFFISSSTIGIWSAQPCCQRCHVNTLKKTQNWRLKMFYQTNRTQAVEITPSSNGMVLSAAAWRCLQRVHDNASCSRTDHSFAARHDGSAQRVFVPGDLDFWPWHAN